MLSPFLFLNGVGFLYFTAFIVGAAVVPACIDNRVFFNCFIWYTRDSLTIRFSIVLIWICKILRSALVLSKIVYDFPQNDLLALFFLRAMIFILWSMFACFKLLTSLLRPLFVSFKAMILLMRWASHSWTFFSLNPTVVSMSAASNQGGEFVEIVTPCSDIEWKDSDNLEVISTFYFFSQYHTFSFSTLVLCCLFLFALLSGLILLTAVLTCV